ncbi:MAG: hypothetical protein ACYSSP_07555 [Planctomycetota bacterium]
MDLKIIVQQAHKPKKIKDFFGLLFKFSCQTSDYVEKKQHALHKYLYFKHLAWQNLVTRDCPQIKKNKKNYKFGARLS